MSVAAVVSAQINQPKSLRYPPAFQVLHWAMAALVAAQFALILVVKQLRSLEFGQWVISIHQQCGCLLLALILLRLALGFRLKAPPSDLPPWQIFCARAVHYTMFAALAVQPVLGLLVSWARGDTVTLLGLVHLPTLVHLTTEQGVAIQPWHRFLAMVLLGLIALHLAAVVFNLVVRRTSVIERMLESPMVSAGGRGAALRRQCLWLAMLVAMVVGVWSYAMRQYAVLDGLRTRFDDIELALLDDMRSAQLTIVTADSKPAGQRTPETDEDIKATAELLNGFAARLSDTQARASAVAAATSLRRAEITGLHGKATEIASTDLQDAIDSQSMLLFEGRMKVSEAAAAGRDMIMLSLAPTIMLSLVLAFLMARNLLGLAQDLGPGRSRKGDTAAKD